MTPDRSSSSSVLTTASAIHDGWGFIPQSRNAVEKHGREDSGFAANAPEPQLHAPYPASPSSALPETAKGDRLPKGSMMHAATSAQADPWAGWAVGQNAGSGEEAYQKRMRMSSVAGDHTITSHTRGALPVTSIPSAPAVLAVERSSVAAARPTNSATAEIAKDESDPWAASASKSGNDAYERGKQMAGQSTAPSAPPANTNFGSSSSSTRSRGRSEISENTRQPVAAPAPVVEHSTIAATADQDDWAAYRPAGAAGGAEAYVKRVAMSGKAEPQLKVVAGPQQPSLPPLPLKKLAGMASARNSSAPPPETQPVTAPLKKQASGALLQKQASVARHRVRSEQQKLDADIALSLATSVKATVPVVLAIAEVGPFPNASAFY